MVHKREGMIRNVNDSHLTFSMNCHNQEIKGGKLIQNTLKPVLYPSVYNDILKFNFNMKI